MTEKEIIQKLKQFKEGLELFKSKLDAEREKNEELSTTNTGLELENKGLKDAREVLLKEKTGLEIENNYLKTQHPAPDANKNYDDIIIQLDELQVKLNDAEALADQKTKEAQEARELAEKIEKKNESLQADLKEKEDNTVVEDFINEKSKEIQELQEKLQKEKNKNKTLAEEALNYKTEIDRDRTKFSKKIEEKQKAYLDTQTLLSAKIAEYSSLEKDYESLQVSYEKELAKVKELKEKAAHSIVTLPANKISNNNRIILHYNLGPTSENVMEKFIQVIERIYKNVKIQDDYFVLGSIEDAAKELDIGQSDTSVIKTRLLGMKAPDGSELLIEDEDGTLKSKLNCESFIGWISKIKEK